MAAPGTPNNFTVQQGNGQVLLTWDLSAGATSYVLSRSLDNVSFTVLATVSTNSYVDLAVTVGTAYYYTVASSNGTLSNPTAAQLAIPTNAGSDSLSSIRLQAQQRADRVNSNFLSMSEWNNNINQSYTELYDLLTNVYEDYYVTTTNIVTDGVTQLYPLPSNFYKVMGVDLALSSGNSAWVSMQKFNFIDRNDYVYPSIGSNAFGVYNARYRIVGDSIEFIPLQSGNQTIRLWYVPRMARVLKDTDILQGVNGWLEYVIVDAAIKALQKEESDVSILEQQKMMLIKRIEESAQNRDVGQPDTISDTRNRTGRFNGTHGGF